MSTEGPDLIYFLLFLLSGLVALTASLYVTRQTWRDDIAPYLMTSQKSPATATKPSVKTSVRM
jgi:hypothetical protein